MRQRLDDTFIDLLSNVRIVRSQSSDLTLLQLKTLPTFGGECHDEAVCVFAENAFVNIHIQEMLEATNDEMYELPAIDILAKIIICQIIKKSLNLNQTDTRGLAHDIKIKVNLSVILKA